MSVKGVKGLEVERVMYMWVTGAKVLGVGVNRVKVVRVEGCVSEEVTIMEWGEL